MADSNPFAKLTNLLTGKRNESYEEIAVRLREARQVFHECVAQQLTQPLHQQMLAMPHETYEEKKNLAIWVNCELRAIGAALRCPNTGEATTLRVDRGSSKGDGRFRLSPFIESSRRTFSSVAVFPITLMPHYERFEPLAGTWVDRTQQSTADTKEIL